MFVLKFLIGIVVLITISLNFFRMARVDGVSSNNKLFNILVFLLILVFLFQVGLNFSMHKSVMYKMGYPGEPGIRGQTGDKGDDGKCVADCGRKVCGTVLERDAHNALTYNIKKLNKVEGAELKKTLVKCAKKATIEKTANNTVIKLPKVDLDVCKKKKKSNQTQSTSDERVDDKCISIEKVSDAVFGSKDLEVRYRIKNRLFLNKLKLICNSKQYLSTLEKEHENKPTEKKLIEYLSSIVIKWVELISNFKFSIIIDGEETKTIYIGLIFLMSPDAEFDIIETKQIDENNTLESPLREIEKYDIWNWGETTSESPLIVTTCLANQTPPLAIQQRLKTIYTNNYEVIFDSRKAYPKDVWDTTNCPYGQMGKDNTNPENVKVCIKKTERRTINNRKCDQGYDFKDYVNSSNLKWWKCAEKCPGGKYLSDNSCNCACEKTEQENIIKKELAWKKTEYRRKTEITFLHPQKYTDKHNNTFYPLGSVWTSLKPNKDGKYGKQTILVRGDILPPVDYIKIWTSSERMDDKKPIFNNTNDITIWRPIAPKGYVAFGDVIKTGTDKPSVEINDTDVVCVAESCVSQLPLGTEIWNTNDIGRVDYKTEENYRVYNNLDLGIEVQEQNINQVEREFNPYANDTNKRDKDDDLSYPNKI